MDKIDIGGSFARTGDPSARKDRLVLPTADITLFAAVAVAAVISLGEVSLNLSSVRNLTLLVSLLYVIATLVYRNRYAVGLEKGKSTAAYLSSYAEYDRLRDLLFSAGLSDRVADFCGQYVRRELSEYREGLLAEVGISYDDYMEKYRGKSALRLRREFSLSPYAVRAVVRCDRARGIKLNKNMILLNDGDTAGRDRPFGFSSKARQRRDYRLNVITRLCVTLLSGVIAVSFIVDPSFSTVIQWCVRMVPILSAAFFGTVNGFSNGSETAVNYLRAQIIKIREIFEWAGVRLTDARSDDAHDGINGQQTTD